MFLYSVFLAQVFSLETTGNSGPDLEHLKEAFHSENMQQERHIEHRTQLWLNSPWPLPAVIEVKFIRILVHISTLIKLSFGARK